ncbi:phosphoribulokinase [Variovorax paradoxus]|uniref:phosphoribulokinase n=1 Tax=Variovorax paradoxus (strain EPS) TaxID=595537 RepID=E6UYG3_VARPE|nr:phosphoribulokinase [Variovorax paradoxus]ADU37787.1 Phosphoribulokinase [Variovorax paradoxus EPS]
MSAKHPIISITGSSGAGKTLITNIVQDIFQREKICSVLIEGDSFHCYDRKAMKVAMADAAKQGNPHFTHLHPEANLLNELENLFREYSEAGTGKLRHYVHNEIEADKWGKNLGNFTEWEPLPENTDCLLYEGLHGTIVTDKVDISKYVDLTIGVVPTINLEWIQKLHRDTTSRGYTAAEVTESILQRMPDYVRYLCPQFSRTHVNIQRIPIIDSSNPFSSLNIPSEDEIYAVIRLTLNESDDFQFLKNTLQGAWMVRPDIVVVPGRKLEPALLLIFTTLVRRLMNARREIMRKTQAESASVFPS